MDALAELRDVWHGFAEGRLGPEAVVAAARRACGGGVQRRAPSLVQLANLQPTHYGHVPDLFNRVRGELQSAAANAQEEARVGHAHASTGQTVFAAGGAAVAAPGYVYPPQPAGAAVPYPYAPPAHYPPPGAHPMGGYPAPVAASYAATEPGLPPGVHGISLKELKELRRVGWICVAGSFFIGLLAIISIANGQKLAKAGDGHGTPMMVIGFVMLALSLVSVLMLVSGN